ncbi:aspartate kinase [Kibdelosporangium aridum]|uniref:Aspartokinase n=1 Tax=Kibdelosporangium aridum TaxID=2030 RepID=A0A428Z0W9_KIBAR|nr:aspartate kinase [Kibdelosporangium aridum]
MLVQKYGGSSLATLAKVRAVAERVARTYKAGNRLAVVLSAQGDTTDELLALAAEMSGVPHRRELDQLLATGECRSIVLLVLALHELGVPAISLTGPQAGINAVGKHGEAFISDIDTGRIQRLLDQGQVVVVAGFQGINADGDIATLGRGGSDTTAVALAAALRADRCEIYTDVDGVYTADPRTVPTARPLSIVDPGVLAELTFAGAKVVHARAVELAAMEQVAVWVGGSFSDTPGTVVPARSDEVMLETRSAVVAVAHDTDVARVLVRTDAGSADPTPELLAILARHAVPVDLVARSGPHEDEYRVGFTIRGTDADEVLSTLHPVGVAKGWQIRVDTDVAKLSLVGMGLLTRPDYASRLLATLAADGITTSWVSISQLRISAVIRADRIEKAVFAVHREFQLEAE